MRSSIHTKGGLSIYKHANVNLNANNINIMFAYYVVMIQWALTSDGHGRKYKYLV